MRIIERTASAAGRAALVAALAIAPACSDDNGGTGTTPPTTGTVAGQVTVGGAGVAGVAIALAGTGTGVTSTGADGRYEFDGLDAGAYTLIITVPADHELASGQTAEKAANVTAGQTAIVNWSLNETGGGGGGGTVVQIDLSGTAFDPGTATIAQGTTVRWNALDGVHTVTPDNPGQPGAWTSTGLSAGESFEHTFTVAGTYDYHCQPHQSLGMTGRIVVQ